MEAPSVQTSAEIFRAIHKEKQMLQSLPKRKGNLRVQILSQSLAAAEFKQVYCYLRNKQFKFYKDDSMMEMEGLIDFDMVQTVIKIDDDSQELSKHVSGR